MPSLITNLYEFGEFRLDAHKRVLRRGQEPVSLTPKAFGVLLLLIQHSGQVVTKDELMQAVWLDSFVEESNLTQTVFMLRKALGERSEHRYIVTAQGRGYQFVADVKEVSDRGDATTNLSVPAWGRTHRATKPNRYWRFRFSLAGVLALVLVGALIPYLRWSSSRNNVPWNAFTAGLHRRTSPHCEIACSPRSGRNSERQGS